MNERLLLIEPRDPVIFRDGRPFGQGLSARSLPFPVPATTIGAVRTRAGAGSGYDAATVERLLEIEQTGPFLVAKPWTGESSWQLCLPAPADAVPYAESNDPKRAIELCPLRPAKDRGGTNLPAGLYPLLHNRIHPEEREGKVALQAPAFWSASFLAKWLSHSTSKPISESEKEVGFRALAYDQRTHLEVNDDRQTAEEGMLFSTSGLVFQHKVKGDSGASVLRYGLASWIRNAPDAYFPPVSPIGGERRVALWSEAQAEE